MVRGAVCEIEWIDAESTQSDSADRPGIEDWKDGEPVIKGVWDTLEVKGARQVFSVPGLGDETSSVRQWCEVLRIRT